MSDKPDIDAIEARLAAAIPGPWTYIKKVGCVYVEEFAKDGEGGVAEILSYHDADGEFIAHAPADIAALLAEVERLQRERAEWRDRADALMTEQMTQMRDLTAEVEALRARLTLTPEKIEAAIQARNDYIWRDGGIHAPTESGELRAALLAAGMTEEALQ